MKISAAFPSKYLKASDLQDRTISVIMSRVELADVGDTERKPVLFFQGKQKGLVLNKTNSRAIAAAYGEDTEAWANKPLMLFPAMVDFRGDTVEAIRVRVPARRGEETRMPARTAPMPRAEHVPAATHESENPRDDMDDEIPF